jgi:L-lysine 2,3-aminomutase
MAQQETQMVIRFERSGETRTVLLSTLLDGLTAFLDHFGAKSLVGADFFRVIQVGNGATKLERLLTATGYPEDPRGFLTDLLAQLAQADGTTPIAINDIPLPYQLLMAVLEIALPGDTFVSVKTVAQLEKLANIDVPETKREDMQQVIDTYPVRLSMHVIRQMRVSGNVAYQYLPFVEELDSVGHTNTWIGQFHQGLLEQMYANRVIFLLNMSCPVYCRFCFRKHKESRNEANPTVAEVERAVEHVRRSPAVKEIVITGGDPFMSRTNMAAAIDGLMAIDHVQTLRLATRSIAYYPPLFLAEDKAYLTYLKRKNLELQELGKRMEVATHFIHPDEISPQSLEIITELVKSGIAVYVQTPFLNNCNDSGPELVKLFSLLRGAGAELHYIYIPCSPIHGNSVYWSPITKGLAAAHHLRAHLSDRVIPRICTATPIGKMDWHTSGWAVEPVADSDDFVWIRSPYTPDYFKSFAPLAEKLTNLRVNAEGTIDIQYMAKLGDQSLFLGPRPPREADLPRPRVQWDAAASNGPDDQRVRGSIVTTGMATIARLHETRVAVEAETPIENLDYIRRDDRITDVVIASKRDAVEMLSHITGIITALKEMPHVNAVRLRSLTFTDRPDAYSSLVIDRLANLNRLSIVNPLRLEIETWFMQAEDIRPEHARIIRRLNNCGITVYGNTPLLGGVNDTAKEIHALAYAYRQAGIEFHHLYLAGLPLQTSWNKKNPVDLYDVVDIATRVRRDGSGREIPRYIIATALGEVDFGLTSAIEGENEQVRVKLNPYTLAYFQGMDPEFSWPDDVIVAEDGHPVIPVVGLKKSTAFALS